MALWLRRAGENQTTTVVLPFAAFGFASYDSYWVGATSQASAGVWLNVDGTPLNTNLITTTFNNAGGESRRNDFVGLTLAQEGLT